MSVKCKKSSKIFVETWRMIVVVISTETIYNKNVTNAKGDSVLCLIYL